MSDIERINEIEHLIATGKLNAAQVFTQMKQLLQAARDQGGEAVANFRAEIRTERDVCDEYISSLVFVSGGEISPYLYIPETLDQGVLDEALRRLNSHPIASVPDEIDEDGLYDPVNLAYCDGWNDCRKEMLNPPTEGADDE